MQRGDIVADREVEHVEAITDGSSFFVVAVPVPAKGGGIARLV